MTSILHASFWDDPGFTEGAVEVPSYANLFTLPRVTMSYDTLEPSKGRWFSELKIRDTYLHCRAYTYLRLEVAFNGVDHEPITHFYGWVDSVEMVSDSENYPAVLVKWHMDLWRTYLAQASFGYGMVERRTDPGLGLRPPQKAPHVRPSAPTLEFSQETNIGWVIVSAVLESYDEGSKQFDQTSNRYITWPVNISNPTLQVSQRIITPVGTISGNAIQLEKVYNGTFDESLGLKPTQILACFVTTVPPVGYRINDDHEVVIDAPGYFANLGAGGNGGALLYPTYTVPELTVDINKGATDDISQLHVVDRSGDIIATLPYGLGTVTQAHYRLVFEYTSLYVQIRFDVSSVILDPTNPLVPASKVVGTTVNVPIPPVPVNSNSWSEYVYSGQREYDIESRKLQQDIEYKQGLVGSLNAGASGAAIGGMKSGSMGALAGGLSAASEIASAWLRREVARSYNDELQELTDSLQARQSENLLTSGSGADWVNYGLKFDWALYRSNIDTYSANLFQSQINLNGVTVSEPTADCTSLVRGSGPLKITNLIVKGPIPVEAKQYIKARINNGVRLI